MPKKTFSSHLHVISAPTFHATLHEIFKEGCVSRLRGEALIDCADLISEEDHCGIRSPISQTEEIGHHFHWLEETIKLHLALLKEIQMNGGFLEFSILHSIKGSRGTQISLSPNEIKILDSLSIGLKITFINFSQGNDVVGAVPTKGSLN